jgi:hypothetical protein
MIAAELVILAFAIFTMNNAAATMNNSQRTDKLLMFQPLLPPLPGCAYGGLTRVARWFFPLFTVPHRLMTWCIHPVVHT